MNKKLVFLAMLVSLLACSLVFFSCGGDSSKLVGNWESEEDGSVFELFKDGTGNMDGTSITWTAENNRLMFTALGQSISMDYKLSGNTLIVTKDGESVSLKKK